MDGEFLILKKDSLLRYGFAIVLSFFLLSFVFFSFFVSADSSPTYSQTFMFSINQPTFSTVQIQNKTYTKIFLEECTPLGMIGYPELPSKTINILIPFKHEIKDIICENIQENDYSLQVKLHDVIPLQSESSFSNDRALQSFEKNETIYKKNMVHPTESFKKRSIHYASGFPIVSLTLNPFQYNPSGKKLTFSSELSLKIIFQPTQQEPINPYFRGQKSDSQPLKEMVINPEAVYTYPLTDDETTDQTVLTDAKTSDEAILGSSYPGGLCDSTESVDYVIVTSELLTDQSNYSYNWTDLLVFRQQQDGFTGRIVTIEDIITCSDYGNTSSIFDDDAARLREFCKDAYLDWNTAYVLLGGDWEEGNSIRQIVPCRIMTDLDENSSGYNTMASDLYFSNLDGDWYDETESVWGGGRSGANDKYSELAVGRIPVSTRAHVSNIVQKIIWYDTCQDDEWLSSAAFLGGDLGDWASTSKDYMEELRNGDGSFSEYTGFEEWNNDFSTYEIDTSHRYYDADYDTESDAVNAWKQAINNNQFSLISHLDHGSRYNTLSLGSGSDLSNSHFFLGTSQACLSGRYTDGWSGSESFLCENNSRGGFAMVLNTGYGYGSSLGTHGASQLHHKIWWDYFFANQTTTFEHWRLGSAMRYSKDRFSDIIDSYSHAYCYVWYSWNLFGDPAQNLRITTNENNINTPPQVFTPSPIHDANDVSVDLSMISITIHDMNGDLLNWTIETSPSVGSAFGNNEENGSKTCMVSSLAYNTEYTWFVNVTDKNTWCNETFSFTTELDPNQAPTISLEHPMNNTEMVDTELESVSVYVSDPDDDLVNYTIEGSFISSVSANDQSNGTKTAIVSSLLPFDTCIHWFVNVTDGKQWMNKTFSFTTRSAYYPEPPTTITCESVNRTSIQLTWTKGLNADHTIIERNSVSDWTIGDGISVDNTSNETLIDHSLACNTLYYYRCWSYNETDQLQSSQSTLMQQRTQANHPPVLSIELVNNSEYQPCSFTFTVSLSDLDADQLDWQITCSNEKTNSSITSNVTSSLYLDDLEYNTTYIIWVNVSDSFTEINHWYQFKTRPAIEPSKIQHFLINPVNKTTLFLSWDPPSSQHHVVLAYQLYSNWNKTEGIILVNSTDQSSFVHTDLQANTTYYYQIWQYDTSDNQYGPSVKRNESTLVNVPPVLSNIQPINGSIVDDLSVEWSVQLSDADNDPLSYWINTTNNASENGSDAQSGLKTLLLQDLVYESTYTVFVTVTDGNDTINEWFTFITPDEPSTPTESVPSSGGGSGGANFIPVIQNTKPIAIVHSPVTGLVNETILLNAQNSTDADDDLLAYRWDFTGDGIFDTSWNDSATVQTCYTSAGVYTATVEVSDTKSVDSTNITVYIKQGNHPPRFMYELQNNSIQPHDQWRQNILIIDADSDFIHYKIDYGDNRSVNWSAWQPSNQLLCLHAFFNHSGTYYIRLLIEDENQMQSKWYTISQVSVLPHTAYHINPMLVQLDDRELLHANVIQFHAYDDQFITTAEPVESIRWYINDEYSKDGEILTVNYSGSKSFTVRCEYTTISGKIYQSQQNMTITKDNNSSFPMQPITFFSGIIFCSLLIAGVFFWKNKKSQIPKEKKPKVRHESVQDQEHVSIEEIRKKVDDFINK